MLMFAIGIASPAPAAPSAANVSAFLKANCYECHGADTQEGKLRLDKLPLALAAPDAAKYWGRIVTRLEAGEMPPPDRKRPPQDQLKGVLLWAKTALAAEAKSRRTEGRARIRRLNRLEYENTIHDLLGVEDRLQDLLPVDETADGFDTASKALSISPVHIQRYMEAADLALQAATLRGPKPQTVKQRLFYDVEKEYTMQHGNNKLVLRPRNGLEMYFYAEPHIAVPAALSQFGNVTRASPGRYRVRISTYVHDGQGRTVAFAVKTTQSKRLLGYFDATPDAPGVAELEEWFGSGDTIIIAPYRLNVARQARGLSVNMDAPKLVKEPEGLALAVQWVEVEGPIYEAWPPIGQRRLFGDTSLKPFNKLPQDVVTPGPLQSLRSSGKLTPVSENPAADAKILLNDFLARAFRRPVTEEDVSPYLELVTQRLEHNECFESSLMGAYRAALCSPDFLFLVEEPGPLSDHALASRLSYFLWRSAPDDALRAVADRGELRRPDVLRRETERLLASPRSQAFVANFLDQWLHLRDIDATMPDKDLFPEFYEIPWAAKVDGLLRESLVAETRLFFSDLLTHDGSLLQLIDSGFTYLNDRLAEFYGLPAVSGVAMRRVPLPADCLRGGVLTQASVLKVTANGSRTSPVLRGAWVLDNILGRPPTPPPPNVGTIEPDTRGSTTIREQLAKHQSSESCATCHRQIDPPGFALECFDPIGQWREFYRTTQTGELVKGNAPDGSRFKFRKGAAVDASGKMPDDKTFSGPTEFKMLALGQSHAVARCLAAKLVTYSTGNRTEPGDMLALDSIVDRAEKRNYGLRTLLLEVVQSELFRNK
jgi:hypothetical protein